MCPTGTKEKNTERKAELTHGLEKMLYRILRAEDEKLAKRKMPIIAKPARMTELLTVRAATSNFETYSCQFKKSAKLLKLRAAFAGIRFSGSVCSANWECG
ncbi:MAG: hypothetical protein JSR44_15125 [Spirochaetes bacterium]|nr:hypothetical protein [Spirochaetota bacterium]